MTTVSRALLTAACLIAPLAGCGGNRTTAAAGVPDTSTPGWTGATFVVGSNSTVASNASATYMQQKWQLTPSR